jgi:hypothetical protein
MSRNQRYCTYCGRRMVPYRSASYPQYVWLRCPRYSLFWQLLGTGFEHDVVIIGDAQPSPSFDPVTGARL